MLARRVVTRPATTIRRFQVGGSQLPRRFILPPRSQSQALPRPNTWLAKIRFRADGKPRSKLIALGFGSLILLNLLSVYSLLNKIEDGKKLQVFIAKLIYVQHTDISYDSIDFDDPISTLSYFKKIYQIVALEPEEEIDKAFIFMMEIFTENAQVQAQGIMRSAAEKIHGAFRELNRDSYGHTMKFVVEVIKEADNGLLRLMRDCILENHTQYLLSELRSS